jgi:hypothetical protein
MIKLDSDFVLNLLFEGKEVQGVKTLKRWYNNKIEDYFGCEVPDFKDNKEYRDFCNNWCEEHQFTILKWEYLREKFITEYIFKYDGDYYQADIEDVDSDYYFINTPFKVKPIREGIYMKFIPINGSGNI